MIPTETTYKIAICDENDEPWCLARMDLNLLKSNDPEHLRRVIGELQRHPVLGQQNLRVVRQIISYERVEFSE